MQPPSSPDGLMTTTFIVTNIHCSSCVSYANDVLSPFSESIRNIDISIIDHTIRIQHRGDIAHELAHELKQAAFEVQHVSVADSAGRTLQELNVGQHDRSVLSGILPQLFMSRNQKKHLQNCNACQEEKQQRAIKNSSLARIFARRRSTDTDVERGILDPELPGSNRQSLASSRQSLHAENAKERVYEAEYSIEGMTCASCTSNVTKEIETLDYVQSVSVNLVANNAKVVFRGRKAKAEEIKELIEDIGYGAELEDVQPVDEVKSNTNSYHVSLVIEGMTCGSCVGAITKLLRELPFVLSVNVDLVSNSAKVIFHDMKNLSTITQAISESGYGVEVIDIDNMKPDVCDVVNAQRSVEIELSGMYCIKCPSNMVAAIQHKYEEAVTVSTAPTLKHPRLTLQYRPMAPELTTRRILEVLNSVDPACSASIYHAPSIEERSRTIRNHDRNRILRHLFVTFVIAIPSFIVGVVYMSLVPQDNSTRRWFEEPVWAGNVMRMDWALFIMTTPAMFYGANIFHRRAIKEIWTMWRPQSRVPFMRRFYRFGSMNLLISAGTSVAYFASLAVLIMDAASPRNENMAMRKSTTYFDTVTFLTLFILIGRFLEAYSKAKTGDAVSMLANLRPSTTLLLESTSGDTEKVDVIHTRQISVDLLEVGDEVMIPYGTSPPIDGVVAQAGDFLFDESSLTGESRPVRKHRGDKIFTGSVNVGDPVRMTVTEIGGTSMLDQIVKVVREGQSKRAPIERLADSLTGYFTPVITVLAISTWIIWLVLGETGVLPHGWLDAHKGGWTYWSLEFAISVFVVACPCGIGLAAPTALFVGGGLAAKNGILVQGGGEAFQEASQLATVVFDKTGTLTEGRMKVTEMAFVDDTATIDETTAITIAKALETASTHPIAKAIVQYCDDNKPRETDLTLRTLDITEIPGQGMRGEFEVQIGLEGTVYEGVIGNERLYKLHVPDSKSSIEGGDVQTLTPVLSSTLQRLQSAGQSTAILAIRRKTANATQYLPVAVFAITDPLRPEAPAVIAALRSQGLEVHICTGDNAQTALAVAAQLSIPSDKVRAGVLPQDKAAYIEQLQQSSAARQVTAFVGDGTNDTPALTVADVSIALSHPEGGGSDIALTSSSFVLLNNDLESILTLVKLSRRVFLRVKMNFIWALIYNVCLLPVAAGVFFPVGATWGTNAHGGFRLSPVWASVAMAGSSVSVVLSSLALKLPELEVRR